MSEIFNGTNFMMANDYNLEDFCQIKKSFELTRVGFLGVLILAILIALMIFGSFSENFFLKAFSIKRNLISLFKMPKDDSVGYLRGMKGIFYIVVVYTHIQIIKYYAFFGDSRNILNLRYGFIYLKYTAVTAPSGPSVFIMMSTILTTRTSIDLIRK